MAVRKNEEARGLEEDVHLQNLLPLESDWVGKRKARSGSSPSRFEFEEQV